MTDFKPDFTQRVQSRIVRVVMNADLRAAHDGLYQLAKSLNVHISKMKIGEFVVFINRAQNQVKMYAAGNTIAHFKTPDGRKMDLAIIGLIPRFFNGTKVDYEGALKEHIETKMKH